MKRREFTRAQKAKIYKDAMDRKGRLICASCGSDCMGKRVEVDHVIPEALRTAADLAKPLTVKEGQALCGSCHDLKTFGSDIPNAAKAKRREANHVGATAPARTKFKSRGFTKRPLQRRASAPLNKTMPPRRMGQ